MGESDTGAELYDELLKATDNLQDIVFSRYAIIIDIQGEICSAKEYDTDLIHENIPINDVIEKGDKIVLGFVDNDLYTPVILRNLTTTSYTSLTKFADAIINKLEEA